MPTNKVSKVRDCYVKETCTYTINFFYLYINIIFIFLTSVSGQFFNNFKW